MDQFIVILHVLAAVLLIGPVTVATSMFAPQLRKVQSGDTTAVSALQLLARVTRTYGFLSALVPVLGLIALFTVDGAAQRVNFHIAGVVAVIAWVVLVILVIPTQRKALVAAGAIEPGDAPADETEARKVATQDASKLPGRAAMFGGIFNLLWVIVFVLMYV